MERGSTMRKRTVFKLGGSALLVGLVLTLFLVIRNPAHAAGTSAPGPGPSSQQKYCEVYVHALATQLKVSVAKLAAANKAALQTTVRKALADGTMSQDQETRIMGKINQLGQDPCTDLARAAAAHQAQYASAHQAVVLAVAGALKLKDAAALESDLASGQTIAQIAAAQHVNLADVNAAYLAAVQDQLKMAVTNGTISQAQADTMYHAVQRAVANGIYPLLRTHR
jgi:hypothetical protein